MSAGGHTPGPLYFDDAGDGRERGYIRTQRGREAGGRGVAVARVVCRAEWGTEAYMANGYLFAAAPDLLAACEEAAECLVRNARVVDAGSVATVARLGQAIALARGGK